MPNEWGCPGCGCAEYHHIVRGNRVKGTVRVKELQGVIGKIVGLPASYVLLISGRRGSGKTTLALEAMTRPWVVTTEMDPALVVNYARRIGQRLEAVSVPSWAEDGSSDWSLNIEDERPRDIVVDSISASGAPLAALEAVRAWCLRTGSRAIVVAHQTKAGEAAGQAAMLHLADVELEIDIEAEHRTLRAKKNRFGGLKQAVFDLRQVGPSQAVRNRYYSIEGHGGDFRLVAYPSQGPHAAYLAAVDRARAEGEDLELPPPPVAVSAQPSRLYPSGWVEPADVDDRRAFAEACGVPYFSPVEA